MRTFAVMLNKEWLEMWRNYKVIWLPLVFVAIGAMQPISMHYMPQILKMAGNMPTGTVIHIPVPRAGEVMAKTFSQYNTMGVLVLALAFMGIVSTERQTGVAALVLVKPVPYFAYIAAKWAAVVSVTSLSLFLGWLATWYYTDLLIGHVSVATFIISYTVYGLWLMFFVTLVVSFSIVVRKAAVAAFLSLAVTGALSILGGVFSRYMKWSPSTLTTHAEAQLMSGGLGATWMAPMVLTVCLVVLLLLVSTNWLRRQEI